MYRASLFGQEYTETKAFSALLHLSTVPAKFVFNGVFVLLLENETRVGDIIFINFFLLLFIASDRAFLSLFCLFSFFFPPCFCFFNSSYFPAHDLGPF